MTDQQQPQPSTRLDRLARQLEEAATSIGGVDVQPHVVPRRSRRALMQRMADDAATADPITSPNPKE